MEIKLIMDEKRAALLMRACETMARLGMSQFKELVELMDPLKSWEEKQEIEQYLKEKLTPDLSQNAYNGIHSQKVPEESQVAWDAYQHIRRELSWHGAGKDWRTEKRDWNAMMGVHYDEPFKVSKIEGDFKVEKEEK